MMGTQAAPEDLFYDFCLDDHVPCDHLLRQMGRVGVCFVVFLPSDAFCENISSAWEAVRLPPAACGLPRSSEHPPDGGASSYQAGCMDVLKVPNGGCMSYQI